jgi:hypothetical protein
MSVCIYVYQLHASGNIATCYEGLSVQLPFSLLAPSSSVAVTARALNFHTGIHKTQAT